MVRNIWMTIWVLPLVLLMSWLYQQTQLNFHRYHYVQEEIESFYRYSGQFDQSISKQLIADYPNYLKTNQIFAQLKKVSLAIDVSLLENFSELDEQYYLYLDELEKEILAKEYALLSFYEKNSVLRNTQSYLISVATTSKTLDSELKVYLLDSLINSSESYTQAEKRRQMLIQALSELKNNQEEAKLILRHLRFYIQQVSALDQWLNDLTSSRLNNAVDKVNDLLKEQYFKDLIVVRQFEAGLFAAGLILLLGLGLVVYLLSKSHQKQQALSNEKFKMQEMMIQSEKMLSVGGLAAGMAHEINNPLAGIIQNLQVIQNRLSTNLPKNLKVAEACHIKMDNLVEYLEKRDIYNMIGLVLEAGQRAAKIVNNTLSFSRKGVGIKTHEDINNVVDQTINLSANDYDLKKKYDFRKIKITRDFSKELPAVLCEASEIQQVLFNIFKNGAQAMMLETPKAPEFKVSTQIDVNDIIVSIKDNGPGMPESVRKRIFEPFFTTKSPGVGTGLGLSVSYFIITKNHHGEMIVNSVEGEGTEFIIKLPLALS